MSELRFDDKVAVVTGAGRGIGRAHALLLASRGAKVVVNDLGIEVDGTGASSGPADEVVAEIRAAGGVAVANPNSVADREGAEGVVDQALEEFGGLDILIHNAGFNLGPFEAILDVHLRAAYWLTERAWPTMMAQKSGRIILTTSAAGLYGDGTGPEFNPKQAYSTAKMALVGMTKALAMRGRPVNINANALSPTGDTRLVGLNKGITNTREGAPPPEATINWVAEHAAPAKVAAGIAWFVHDDCRETGRVLAVGAGRVAEVFIGVTEGYINPDITPEDVRDNVKDVFDQGRSFVPVDMTDYAARMRKLIGE
jgi:NAD(P)-dependent dehydrogenase (short-subunit alcohol dehydrogenase family)